MSEDASAFQISSKSVKLLQGCHDISALKLTAVHHLEFLIVTKECY